MQTVDEDGVDLSDHQESAAALLENRETEGVLRSQSAKKELWCSEYSTKIVCFYLMEHLYKAMVSLESAAAALENRETEKFFRRPRARNRVIEH